MCGRPGGAGIAFSLHSQQSVGSSPGAALVPLEVPSVNPSLSWGRRQNVLPLTTNFSQNVTEPSKGISYPVGDVW